MINNESAIKVEVQTRRILLHWKKKISAEITELKTAQGSLCKSIENKKAQQGEIDTLRNKVLT